MFACTESELECSATWVISEGEEMKKTSSWLWGGVLIALGVILAVNALGIARIDIFFPGWWTLFIIVPSLICLFTDEHKSGAVAGLIIGVCFLISSLGIVSFSMLWKLLLPALLILVGFTVIVRGNTNGKVAEKIEKARKRHGEQKESEHIVEAEVVFGEGRGDDEDDDDEGDEKDNADGENESESKTEKKAETENDDSEKVEKDEYWSTFSDQQVNYNGKKFTGCKVDAVFGGADVDLRGAKIQNEAIVKASSIFGGIIIYVPENVKVEVASTSIFGGVTDKRKSKAAEMNKTLYIEATCVFGGVEIR